MTAGDRAYAGCTQGAALQTAKPPAVGIDRQLSDQLLSHIRWNVISSCSMDLVVSHLKSLQKQLVAAKRKGIARCARINAVALAFLISTEGANAANQWLVQNQHSGTLAKVRFFRACRSIYFRGTCLKAQLRFVSA
jgi:hypothetical protein